jgi:tetraacyldisaccharide 4'-kinase
LAALKGRPLKALAGIAKPEAFFAMLRAEGLQLAQTVALPDHHDFSDAPVSDDGCDLICTEKDAVKLWPLRPQAWAVPLLLAVEPEFWTAFDRLLDAKLSSAHGPQTS